MRTENVMYFTEKEEEFANLLIEIGTKKNVAKVQYFWPTFPKPLPVRSNAEPIFASQK